MYILNNSLSMEQRQQLLAMHQQSISYRHKNIEQESKSKSNNKGMNRLKREMAAMLPILENIKAKNKEHMELAKLDMEIQARAQAYKEESLKKL